MEKDIFDIIQEKEYSELSNNELLELADFCADEDEFLQMKSVLLHVQEMNLQEKNMQHAAAPKPQVKQKLDDLFVAQPYVQTSATASKSFMTVLYPRDKKLYQRPLFQIAAIVILMLGIVPFLMKNQVPINDKQLAKNELNKENVAEENKKDSATSPSETERTKTKATKKVNDLSVVIPELSDYKRYEELSYYEAPVSGNSSATSNQPTVPFFEIQEVTAAVGKSDDEESAFDHSDGIFDTATGVSRFSKTVSDQTEVLDLLVASF